MLIDGLPIVDFGRVASVASALRGCQSTIGNPSIVNRPIGNPSIVNLQSPIGNDLWAS
jgi:hypothetical protein